MGYKYKNMRFVFAALVALVSAKRLNQQFATGVNGDEDLAQDIIMKGEKFHYIEKYGMTAEPTCTERITRNCRPICTESLTRGCTEAPAPEPPQRNRFEGKYTWKGSNTNK